MKKILLWSLLVLMSVQGVNAQDKPVIRNSNPIEGEKAFTAEVYQQMLKDEKIVNEIKAITYADGGYYSHEQWLDNLSDDHRQWMKENEDKASYYGVGSGGLEITPFNAYEYVGYETWESFGGGPYWKNVSSELSASYGLSNLIDNDLRTAWVEGKEDDGIGESITYRFENASLRVQYITIFNGYVKSDKIWQANNRVKELEVLLNNKPYATLLLDDTWQRQRFKLPDPLGRFESASDYFVENEPINDERWVSWDRDSNLTKYWTLTLRIASVYSGTKYRDTAISEIYFGGLDGPLCIAKGAMIMRLDNDPIAIENLKEGDDVCTFDRESGTVKSSTVKRVHTVSHSNLVQVTAGENSVTLTDSHPLYTHKGWSSYNPENTKSSYPTFDDVYKYKRGYSAQIINDKGTKELVKIDYIRVISESALTYSVELSNGDNVIANGFVVGAE